MAIHVYSFLKDGTGRYRPFIPIRLTNPIERISTNAMALLDTGADDCVFPKFIADGTKHTLKGEGVESMITQGVGENKVEVWKHTFVIELISDDRKKIIWKSKQLLVNCLDHNNAPILLGSSNFLSNFKITFNYPTKKILIEV